MTNLEDERPPLADYGPTLVNLDAKNGGLSTKEGLAVYNNSCKIINDLLMANLMDARYYLSLLIDEEINISDKNIIEKIRIYHEAQTYLGISPEEFLEKTKNWH